MHFGHKVMTLRKKSHFNRVQHEIERVQRLIAKIHKTG